VRRIFINNRAKDKKLENDSTYDGVYLYKPGVELPSLYQFANQTVFFSIRRLKSSLLRSTSNGITQNSSKGISMVLIPILPTAMLFASWYIQAPSISIPFQQNVSKG
jgi:hypothetical protein